MSLKQQIQADVIGALKEGNKEVAEVLRMTISAINAKEKEKRYKISKDPSSRAKFTTGQENQEIKEEDLIRESQLTDEEVIDVLSSEIKKRKDAIALYEQGNRPELVAKEQKEVDVLKKYLPEQLSSEELRRLVEEAVQKVGAKEMKDMGKVMADLMPKVKGKADNSEISKIIKELIGK